MRMTKTRSVRLAIVVMAALGCGPDASGPPVISTLQNDDFTSGGTAAFQSGFITGEAAAVRLGPQSLAFTVRKVVLLFGGDTTTNTVTLTVYQDGGTLAPGSVLHSADYALTGSNAAFREIDLTSQNIHVAASQAIRVAVWFQHDGLPAAATDDARIASRNLIYAIPGGWSTAESFLLPGDFIIRAEISTP